MSTGLVDAFRQFGAKPKNPNAGRSAIAGDGALVLSCAMPRFKRHAPGVLRYEDELSRDARESPGTVLLQEHLTLARDGQLPVRMVVIAAARGSKARRHIYARPDLVGKLTEFDGDRFIVDFTRVAVEVKPAVGGRRRRTA